MKDSDKESIIKDLLFEAASRKKLQSHARFISIRRFFSLTIAAIFAFGIIAYTGILNSQNDSNSRQKLVADAYSFPNINKSRSAQNNIIDNYISELKTGKYKFVLTKLNGSNLSEMDNYIKAHLLFNDKDLTKCTTLINSVEWEDEYIESDVNLLLFYCGVNTGKSMEELSGTLTNLNESDALKANELIAEIKKTE